MSNFWHSLGSRLSIANKRRGGVRTSRRAGGKGGFTLIELLVVIAILGILVATFAVSTASARQNARITKATAESRELGNAIRLFCLTMLDTAESDDGGDPLSDLGLSEGTKPATDQLTRILTQPGEKNGNTVYFNANERSIRRNVLCDPWGNPYYIRVKKVSPNVKDEESYTILVPVVGRHRALEPLK